MRETVELKKAKRQLAILWFSCGVGLFLLLVAQSLFNRFEDRTVDAWEWFLPTLMPTLSLMI